MFYLSVEYLIRSFELWCDLMLALSLSFFLCIRPREFMRRLYEGTETPMRDPAFYRYWLAEWVLEDTDETEEV